MESITELRREAVPDIDPDRLIGQDTLQYAESVLGYKHPEHDRALAKGTLAVALRIMGLQPFTFKSVKRYKDEEIRRHAPTDLWKNWRTFAVRGGNVITILGLLISFLPLMDGLVKHCTTGEAVGLRWFGPFTIFLTAFMLCRIGTWKSRKEAHWQIVPLKGYASPVPEFALATAMEIHQRVPNVELLVEELLITRAKTVFQADPFLIARCDGEEFYVEVWREPGYRQERMA